MSKSYIEPQNHALLFLNQAYGEYLAARCLLMNDFYIEGATMASYAVEKYIKVQLVVKGLDVRIHLDNIERLRQALIKSNNNDANEDFTKLFDEHFFTTVSTIYKMRYYNNLTEETNLDIHLNQFLCELDYFAYLSQRMVTSITIDGKEIKSAYRIDVENDEYKLKNNNYLFMGVSKKEFMEKPGVLFLRKITPGPNPIIVDAIKRNQKPTFDGRMTKVTWKFEF